MKNAAKIIENIYKNLYLKYDKNIDEQEEEFTQSKSLSTNLINGVLQAYQYVRDKFDPSTVKITAILKDIVAQAKKCKTYDDWISFIILCGDKAYELESIKTWSKGITQSRSCKIAHMMRSYILTKHFKDDPNFYHAINARKELFSERIKTLDFEIIRANTSPTSNGKGAQALREERDQLMLSIAYLVHDRTESHLISRIKYLQPHLLTIEARERELGEKSACRRFNNENHDVPNCMQNWDELSFFDTEYLDTYWKQTHVDVVRFVELDGEIITKNTDLEQKTALPINKVPSFPTPIPNTQTPTPTTTNMSPPPAPPAPPVNHRFAPAAKPKAAALPTFATPIKKETLPVSDEQPPAPPTPQTAVRSLKVSSTEPGEFIIKTEDGLTVDLSKLHQPDEDYIPVPRP